MSRWFRVKDDLIDNPKIQRLSGDLVKSLLNIWCLASKHGGILPPIEDIAFRLRMTPQKALSVLGSLQAANLIDSDGTSVRPHDWNEHQYKSDVSTERVRAFRKRTRNATSRPLRNGHETFHATDGTVTGTVAETETKRPQSQRQNTDTEAVLSSTAARDARATPCDDVVKSGITPEAFQVTAKVLAIQKLDPDDPKAIGTAYQVQTWMEKGWDTAAIVQGVETVMARQRDPPRSPRYFEAAIAQVVADRASPLPVATASKIVQIGVGNGKFHEARKLGPHGIARLLEEG